MAKKKRGLNIPAVAVIVVIAAVLTQVLFSAFAAACTLRLSPNKTSVQQGEEFTVTLSASSDTIISIAEARITYDPAQVQMLRVSRSGSPLSTNSPGTSNGNGFVQTGGFVSPPATSYPSGDVYISTISFKALQPNGTASINIDQGASKVYSAVDASNILSGVSGTSINLSPIQVGASNPGSSNNVSSGSTDTAGSTGSTPNTNGTTSSGASGSIASIADGSSAPGSLESYATSSSSPDLQEPGKSQLGTNPSILNRLFSWVRAVVPFVVVLSLIGVVVFFASRKLQHHAYPNTVSVGSSVNGPTSTSNGVSKAPTKPNTGSAGPGFGVLIGKDNQKK
ncbi:hypothetical protein KC950_03710 [Candidatus Saccharibacteria bacterium]|nr:hypothetical protein [Candidatus Saccharibacteria bacterium]